MQETVKPVAAQVARAEAEAVSGLKKLASDISQKFKKQRFAQDMADMHGLEIGRMISEFAARPEVLAKVAVLNANKNGAPKVAHCWVAEQIAKAAKVSERHLERCARAYKKAKEKGMPLTTPMRAVEFRQALPKFADNPDPKNISDPVEDAMPSPERLFDSREVKPIDPAKKPEFDIEREAERFVRTIKSLFYTENGLPKIQSKTERRKFAKACAEACAQMNIDFEELADFILPELKGA